MTKIIEKKVTLPSKRCRDWNGQPVSGDFLNCSRSDTTVNAYRKLVSDRYVSRRPRPTGPLYLYPTSYPRVSTWAYTIDSHSWTNHPIHEYHSHWQPRLSFDDRFGFAPNLYSVKTDWKERVMQKVSETSFTFGEMVAEYRETSKLFLDTARLVYDSYRFLKGKPLKFHKRHSGAARFYKGVTGQSVNLRSIHDGSLKSLTRTASGVYLGGRYGVTPLLLGLAEAYAHLGALDFNDPRLHFKIVGKGKFKSDKVTEGGKLGSTGLCKRTDRAVCWFKFNRHYDPFEFGNPLEIGWELVPLSFVVDWIFPIGTFLSSIDAFKGVDLVSGTLSTKTEMAYKKKPQESSPGYIVIDHYNRGTASHSSYQRILLKDSDFGLIWPSYKPSKYLLHVVDGLALLASARSR